MIKRKFELTLAMLNPKNNANIDFTSSDLSDDIYDACDEFNIYHKNKQILTIINITKSKVYVQLELFANQDETIELYRKISLLSRRLYNKFRWQQYSDTNNRLFTIVSSTEITSGQTKVEVATSINNNIEQLTEPSNIDLKKEKLRFLYAQKRYTEILIQELEEQGITIE
ncbi:hypothetical protein AB2T85_20630 [Clostridium butyricum]|uniref:hypothetical protein n=1 Tax=Clostridium butyricum TaxID=1492 RepID=UPI00346680A6